jgi:hypothetical protein
MVNVICVLAFVNVLIFSRGFALKAEEDSYRDSAAVIQEYLCPEDDVIAYKNLAQGLGFYLKRRVVLANALGELEFGARQEKDPRWFIGSRELKNLWNGDRRVFLVVEKKHVKEIEQLLEKNVIRLNHNQNKEDGQNKVVLSNR